MSEARMTLDVHFTGGPLDGATLEGELLPKETAKVYLATKIYRDTHCGLVGSIFEMFNPFMLMEGTVRTRVGLHRYRIDLHLAPSETQPLQLYVSYVAASSLTLGASQESIREWVER